LLLVDSLSDLLQQMAVLPLNLGNFVLQHAVLLLLIQGRLAGCPLPPRRVGPHLPQPIEVLLQVALVLSPEEDFLAPAQRSPHYNINYIGGSVPVLGGLEDVAHVLLGGVGEVLQAGQFVLQVFGAFGGGVLVVDEGDEDGDVAESLVVDVAVEVDAQDLLGLLDGLHLLLDFLHEDGGVHELLELLVVVGPQSERLQAEQHTHCGEDQQVLPSIPTDELEHLSKLLCYLII
jgi:hypothetical protein